MLLLHLNPRHSPLLLYPVKSQAMGEQNETPLQSRPTLGSARKVCSARFPNAAGLDRGGMLLNLILSYDAPLAANQRAAMRSSWLMERVEGYTHLFVIGGSPRPAFVRGDELWLPSSDTYRGGPSKVLDAFRYVVEHEMPYKYLLKTDSDSLVCISRLMTWLGQNKLPATGVYAGDPQTYYGRLDMGFGYKFDDHNYVSVFNQSTYTRYNLGGGYILSRDVVQHVVREAGKGGFLAGGKWRREADAMPYMEDALVGKLVDDFADMADMPVTARANPDNYRLEVRYPSRFCQFIMRPKVLCNQLKGQWWCSRNAPLMIVHPVELVRPNIVNQSRLARYRVRMSPAERFARRKRVQPDPRTEHAMSGAASSQQE